MNAQAERGMPCDDLGLDDVRRQQIGWACLIAAAAILLIACLRNIGDPWENGMRGSAAARYSDVAVAHTLRYGLGVTLGMPAFVFEAENGDLLRNVNDHHPPGYWLYLAGWAWVFGNTAPVLRAAHLVLFLPGLLGLFLLVRRRAGPIGAGLVSLLFATCPLVAYFGPMVLQDGAVLSGGLLTLWRFQCHLDRPSRRNWLYTAALFFMTVSWDFSGYWWGLAMFVLALGQAGRGRAVLWVMSFFPVSVLAFAVLAMHYGLEHGGPMGYVGELLKLLNLSARPDAVADWRPGVSMERFLTAMHVLWIGYGNQFVLASAVLGAVVTVFVGGLVARRLAVVGLAMMVPGILNYVGLPRHAVEHEFWSMHGFAGLCALAALTPIAGIRLIVARGAARTVAGVLLLSLFAFTLVWGEVATHRAITDCQYVESDTIEVIQKALPHLTRCQTTLSSASVVSQVQYEHTSVFFGVVDEVALEGYLRLGRMMKMRGQIGFVVHPRHRGTKLTDALDAMASRVEVGDIWVYKLRLDD